MRVSLVKFIAVVGWVLFVVLLQWLWSQNYNNPAREMALVSKQPPIRASSKPIKEVPKSILIQGFQKAEREYDKAEPMRLREEYIKKLKSLGQIVGCSPAYRPDGQLMPYYKHLLNHGIELDSPKAAPCLTNLVSSKDEIQFTVAGDSKPKTAVLCLRYAAYQDQQAGCDYIKKTWLSDKTNKYSFISTEGFIIVTRNADDKFTKLLTNTLVEVYQTPPPTIEIFPFSATRKNF